MGLAHREPITYHAVSGHGANLRTAERQFMRNLQSRRTLLKTASLATAAALAGKAPATAQTAAPMKPEPFKFFPEARIAEAVHNTQAKPGNENLLTVGPQLPFSVTITTEVKKSGVEFEYHEGRDHIFQILEGTTVYELGGTPQNGRVIKPGEWLAPKSEGFSTVTLHKGDLLTIPRGTPHRRRTEGSVTLMLTSIEGK